jgi:hypothetical protein
MWPRYIKVTDKTGFQTPIARSAVVALATTKYAMRDVQMAIVLANTAILSH